MAAESFYGVQCRCGQTHIGCIVALTLQPPSPPQGPVRFLVLVDQSLSQSCTVPIIITEAWQHFQGSLPTDRAQGLVNHLPYNR